MSDESSTAFFPGNTDSDHMAPKSSSHSSCHNESQTGQDDDCMNFLVPPLMIQTLVENGIKHGTSKLPEGGTLELQAQLEGNKLKVTIYNSGFYDEQATSETGFGISNTKQRLDLLYGKEAVFSIKNENHKVKTLLLIPSK